jgi:hypothetical protein
MSRGECSSDFVFSVDNTYCLFLLEYLMRDKVRGITKYGKREWIGGGE